jgi:integrase
MWFMRSVRAAGLTGYPLHGLRKAAARRMAEAGLTNQQIKSITGHTTDSEVARYTREAEQVLIADRAMDILANPQKTA